MKNILLIAVAVFVALGVYGYSQTVDASDEVKVEHYAGQEFSDEKQAIKALTETSEKMAQIAGKENLDVAMMEEIHETSYTTEDAIAYLGKSSQYDLTPLAAKLEEVHLSSEGHQADALRRNFMAYQAELGQYLASRK